MNAEELGREAVRLGFDEWAYENRFTSRLSWEKVGPFYIAEIPRFTDELTEYATIGWVRDVAREVYGDVCFAFDVNEDGDWFIRIDTVVGRKGPTYLGPTLPHAAIAAVRAAKGAT